jgi:MFS family permease
LFNVARIPGALLTNLLFLAGVAVAATALIRLTGDLPQWSAYGLGVYAVFSWVQSLKQRDPATYRLIWGTPITLILGAAFGSISFVTYAVSFWGPPYVLRTFYADPAGPASFIGGMTAPEEVAFIMGWGAALSAAFGVIVGGIIADAWRRRDPRGRIFVNMASVILAAPATWFIFTTDSLATFYWFFPLAHMLGAMWVGAAVATLQDLVLPRMRATAGATYILGTTMVGLALGPYFAGKVADLADSLRTGIFALYLIVPFTILGLWLGSRRLADLEESRVERARAVGEDI